MKILLSIFLTLSSLFSANLLTYNVYERSDRIDVMLSFDSPHEGSISQKNDASSITLSISDLHYEKMVEKSINSTIIQELLIVPEGNSLKVTLKSNQKISVTASKTVDGFGLRIRGSIMQASTQAPSTAPVATPNVASSSVEDILDTRYLIVIAVLILLSVLMLWIKKRMNSTIKNTPANAGKSWLFNPKTGISKEVTLLHKRPLDNQNSVVLFEYGDIKYLVMTGNTNVLLEKFQHGEVKDNSDFEKVFEENRRRLDEYLKIQDTKLGTYKNKASADYRSTEY
jgi:hypothetical protein